MDFCFVNAFANVGDSVWKGPGSGLGILPYFWIGINLTIWMVMDIQVILASTPIHKGQRIGKEKWEIYTTPSQKF